MLLFFILFSIDLLGFLGIQYHYLQRKVALPSFPIFTSNCILLLIIPSNAIIASIRSIPVIKQPWKMIPVAKHKVIQSFVYILLNEI